MTQSIQPGRFGESGKPDDAWLAKQEKEPILEPELPIIDTHHHLWDRGGWTYLLPELLADLNTGHNIVATVFEECRSMYRANGPVEMRPVGEIEFVAGCRGSAAVNAAGSVELRPRCGFGRPLARTRLGRVLQVPGLPPHTDNGGFGRLARGQSDPGEPTARQCVNEEHGPPLFGEGGVTGSVNAPRQAPRQERRKHPVAAR